MGNSYHILAEIRFDFRSFFCFYSDIQDPYIITSFFSSSKVELIHVDIDRLVCVEASRLDILLDTL